MRSAHGHFFWFVGGEVTVIFQGSKSLTFWFQPVYGLHVDDQFMVTIFNQVEGGGLSSCRTTQRCVSNLYVIPWGKTIFRHSGNQRTYFLHNTSQELKEVIRQIVIQRISLVVQWLRLYSQCRGPRIDPWSWSQIPHAATKSSHAISKDPTCRNKDRRSRILVQPNKWF